MKEHHVNIKLSIDDNATLTQSIYKITKQDGLLNQKNKKIRRPHKKPNQQNNELT